MFRPYVSSDVKLCTHYLELLCHYEPSAVMDFVKKNDSLHLSKAITVRNIEFLLFIYLLF